MRIYHLDIPLRYVVLAVVLTCLGILYAVDPMQSVLAPKCILKLLTGYDCPGCGFQRAVHAFLHGHILQAARYNLFLLVGVPYLAVVFISDYLMRGETRRRWQRVTHNKWLALTYVALYLIWWVVRNVYHL